MKTYFLYNSNIDKYTNNTTKHKQRLLLSILICSFCVTADKFRPYLSTYVQDTTDYINAIMIPVSQRLLTCSG